jgi:hypothetical protein
MKKLIIALFTPVILMSCATMVSPPVTETSFPMATVTNNLHVFTPTSTLSLIDTSSLTPAPTYTDTPKILNSQNNHGYQLFFTIGQDWLSARDYCAAFHAHLLTIESESENEFVSNNLRPGLYAFIWLGLTDRIQEGIWVSVTGEPLTYTNWNSGEPDNCINGCGGAPPNSEEEDYAIFNFLLNNWSDWSTAYIPFVCEWETSE